MPAPPRVVTYLVRGLVKVRRFVLRYLALPRSLRSRKAYIAPSLSGADDQHYHALRSRAFPWYIASTPENKLKAQRKGRPQPGPQYHDGGYKLLELGPDELQGKGKVEMAEMARSTKISRDAM
jgi:hypothetical protein